MNKEECIKEMYRMRCPYDIWWKSYKEKPKEGLEVWVLKTHWKGHFPSSFEISAGEVEYGIDDSWRVNTCDYNGCGCECFEPGQDNDFLYWCDKWQISVPEEVINWEGDSGIYDGVRK